MDFSSIPRAALPALLRTAPKAELHVHIEGTLEPGLAFRLARRHGLSLPFADEAAMRAANDFTDLQSFLDLYYAGASVLRDEDDFHELGIAYFRGAAANGVVRAEVFFDPQTHTARGVPIGAVIGGLARAVAQAKAESGLSAALILCFLRHLSEAEAFDTLRAAMPHRDHVIGVGLDSSERGHPPEKFERVFAAARAEGLHRVAHAGEEGPPAYIEAALDVLHAERIDHGVRCTESPALVQRLARERVPLTVCPLSNVKLRVFPELRAHNLKALLAAGLAASVHSDDPAYFGGDVNENLVRSFEALPALDAADAHALLANSLHASFAPAAERARWRAALDAHFAAADAGAAVSAVAPRATTGRLVG
jgi:adenosine deaminase